jgi:hypothetical protein
MVITNKTIYTSIIVVLVWPYVLNGMDELPLELHRHIFSKIVRYTATIALYCDSIMHMRHVCKNWNLLLHPSEYDHLHAYGGKHCSVGMKGNLIRQACQGKQYGRARLLFALLRPEDDIHIPIKLAISKFDVPFASHVATSYVRRLDFHDRVLLHYFTGNRDTIITRYPLTSSPTTLEEEGKLIRIAMRGGNTHLAQRLLAQLYILGVGASKSSTFLPAMARAAIRWHNKAVLEDVLWCVKETHAPDIAFCNKVWNVLELARQGVSCADGQEEQIREKVCQLIEKGDFRQRLYITYILAKQNQDRAFMWCVDTWRQGGYNLDHTKLCSQAAYMGNRVMQQVVGRYNISLDKQNLRSTFRIAMTRGDEGLLTYLSKQLWSPKVLWLTAAAQRGYYSIVKQGREGSSEDDDLFSLACHNGHQEIADYIAMINRHTRYGLVLHKAVKSSSDTNMRLILCVLMAKQSCKVPICEVIDLIFSRNDHTRNKRDMLQLMRLAVQHDIGICWEVMSQYSYIQEYREQYEQMRAQKERSKKE